MSWDDVDSGDIGSGYDNDPYAYDTSGSDTPYDYGSDIASDPYSGHYHPHGEETTAGSGFDFEGHDHSHRHQRYPYQEYQESPYVDETYTGYSPAGSQPSSYEYPPDPTASHISYRSDPDGYLDEAPDPTARHTNAQRSGEEMHNSHQHDSHNNDAHNSGDLSEDAKATHHDTRGHDNDHQQHASDSGSHEEKHKGKNLEEIPELEIDDDQDEEELTKKQRKPLIKGNPFNKNTLKQSWQQSGTLVKTGAIAGFAVGSMSIVDGVRRIKNNITKQDIDNLQHIKTANENMFPEKDSRTKQLRIGVAEIAVGAVIIGGTALGFTHKVRQAQVAPSAGPSI